MAFGLVTACRLAVWPTRRSLFFVNATTEGVVRPPSWFAITVGWPACITATTELVVPKSIPITLPMLVLTGPGSLRNPRKSKGSRTMRGFDCFTLSIQS